MYKVVINLLEKIIMTLLGMAKSAKDDEPSTIKTTDSIIVILVYLDTLELHKWLFIVRVYNAVM